MIILNSVEAAVDLMEKRSSNYSDRPDFPIFQMYALCDNSTLVLHSYDTCRKTGWAGVEAFHFLVMVKYFGNIGVCISSIFPRRKLANIDIFSFGRHGALPLIFLKMGQIR